MHVPTHKAQNCGSFIIIVSSGSPAAKASIRWLGASYLRMQVGIHLGGLDTGAIIIWSGPFQNVAVDTER